MAVAFVDFLISFVHSGLADDLVPIRAGLANLLLPVFVLLAFLASLAPVSVDHRAQRQVSRLPLHHSFHRSIWVCMSLRSGSARRRAGNGASLFPQSDGRRHRRISLVHSRRRKVSFICLGLC